MKMKKFIRPLFVILLLFVFVYMLYNFIIIKYINKHKLEKNSIQISEMTKNSPFEISKIIIYSSGYGENQNTTFSQSSWVLNILQYSDIAIYLKNKEGELSDNNSIKNLCLEDIHIEGPEMGAASLYYLDSLNFGTANIDENYKIENAIDFTVLNDTNAENKIQYNTPVFFTDCSNPITLKYVNSPVKKDYTITSNEPVFFDGRLLQLAEIPLDKLSANVSLTISVQNNDDQDFSYRLSIPIILENGKSSVYDGSILVENEYENYKFMEELN